MKLLTLLYVFCLFYVFIPGNVIKLPIKTSKMNVILIHALLFTVILSCTYGLVDSVSLVEGMGHMKEDHKDKKEHKDEKDHKDHKDDKDHKDHKDHKDLRHDEDKIPERKKM